MTRESKNFLIPLTIVVFLVVFATVGLGLWFVTQGQPSQVACHEQAAPSDDVEDSQPEEPSVAESDPAASYGGPPEELFEKPHACEALVERESSLQEEQEEALLGAAWQARGDGLASERVLPGYVPKLEKIRLSAQSPEMERMLMALLPAQEPEEASTEEAGLSEDGIAAFEERAEEMATRSRVPPGRMGAQGGGSESNADLRQDIEHLQGQVEQLQDRLETHMNSVVSRLESENARLRQELQELRAQRQVSEGASPSGVPQPRQQDWLDEMIQAETGEDSSRPPDWLAEGAPRLRENPAFRDALEAYSGAEGGPGGPQEESAGGGTPAELDFTGNSDIQTHGSLSYTVTREWGRDPDPQGESEQEAASLQGMIGAVGPDASEEELLDFAAQLRERYEDYDNINIEFFRGARAARQFAENSVAPPGSRVLSVSKHAGTGRDVILLIQGDDVEEYEWPDDFGEEGD
ncbi:MAG: hypothetical protein R6W89_12480 [Candidatus Hydrogenedentota bacterium]